MIQIIPYAEFQDSFPLVHLKVFPGLAKVYTANLKP